MAIAPVAPLCKDSLVQDYYNYYYCNMTFFLNASFPHVLCSTAIMKHQSGKKRDMTSVL